MAMTVLIIDDEDNARENIGQFLTARGYEVKGAATLAEGRASLQRGDGDIILLDVQMPDGYGPNLLYETAGMPFRPPIILITAYGDIDMAVDAMKNGAHDFLTKPIVLNQLLPAVAGIFGMEISTTAVSHAELMIFGGLIVWFLIVEPHGLARLWSTAKQKLRLWPFPH